MQTQLLPSKRTLPEDSKACSSALAVLVCAPRPFSKLETVLGITLAFSANSLTVQSSATRAILHCFGVKTISYIVILIQTIDSVVAITYDTAYRLFDIETYLYLIDHATASLSEACYLLRQSGEFAAHQTDDLPQPIRATCEVAFDSVLQNFFF